MECADDRPVDRTLPAVFFTDTLKPTAVTDSQTNPTRSDYLLVCQARAIEMTEGYWQFDLESADGTPVFSANDHDLGDLNRLTLLAAVRGLESIDGPASVTLISSNRYLIRSLSDSLPRWRSNGFMWEHFGRRIDVQHADLWRRIDRAIAIHFVQACLVSSRNISSGQNIRSVQDKNLRIDSPHPSPSRPTDPLRRWLMNEVAGSAPQAPVEHRSRSSRATNSTPRIVIRNRKSPEPWQAAATSDLVLQTT